MQCVSAVCIPMRYVYIARSVLVGHSCLSRFAQKDFITMITGAFDFSFTGCTSPGITCISIGT